VADLQIPLAEAIRALRQQIVAAHLEGDAEGLQLDLGPIEIEFQLVASRDASGSGGINFGVVTLGAGGKVSQGETHRVKVTLMPRADAPKEREQQRGG